MLTSGGFPPQARPRSQLLFFTIFGLSGFSGLMYESVWTHYIKLFLGHAAYAQTLVLAIFMGGMALGSWLASRFSLRWKNLLLVYAWIEGLVGVAALCFHRAFVGATDLAYDSLIPALGSPALIEGLKWSVSAAFVLPQSILLGMTFPLMSAGIIRRFPGTPGQSLAMLYFTNSFGAALGVLASGFLLIGQVGLPGTMLTAGTINVLLATTVWLLTKDHAVPALAPTVAPAEEDIQARWLRLLLAAALVTGAASFLYEIAWIRMLSLVLGSSTHSFELMLSAFILGLAFGGLWIRRRIDRLSDPVRFLAYVQLAMGLLALATIPLYNRSFDLMELAIQSLAKTEEGYTLFHASSHLICLLVMLPATFCAGMTLPLMTFLLLKRGVGEKSIGAVYGANTLGAIVGVLAAVHLIMPALGVKGTVVAGAALDALLGMILLTKASPAVRRLELGAASCMATAGIALTIGFATLDPLRMLSGVFRSGEASLPKDVEVLYRKDGKTATVGLFRWPDGTLTVSTNGKPDAAMRSGERGIHSDEATMVLLAALPLAVHPAAKTAANIGMGSGLSTHVLLSAPQLERVDTIEIEAAMVEAARGFGARVQNAYLDPRSHIHIDDAKTFFSKRGARYDIILSEPSNPWVSGVASLFSEEFYGRIKHHLNAGGVFAQWIQLYEIDPALVASIMRALSPHFEDYVVYSPNGYDMLVIARREGRIPQPDPRVLSMPGLERELARLGLTKPEQLEGRKLASKAVLDPLFRSYGVPANSDYFPYVDQNAARARYMTSLAVDLTDLSDHWLPILQMVVQPEAAIPDSRGGVGQPLGSDVESSNARALRDALVSGRYGDLQPGTKAAILMPVLLLDACGRTSSDELWIESLLEMSRALMPHLARAELEPVWKRIESAKCFPRLTDRQRQWYELVRSVARRDAPVMAARAQALIERGYASSPARKRDVVLVGMLGNIAKGTPGQGFMLWLKHGQQVLPFDHLPMDGRLLLSLTGQARTSHGNVAVAPSQPTRP